MISASTRKGQRIIRFLEANPQTRSPTVLADATGCTRPTARRYLQRWHHAAPEPPASTDVPAGPSEVVEAELPVQAPTRGEPEPSLEVRSFEADFPGKPAVQAPASPPDMPTARIEEAEDEGWFW